MRDREREGAQDPRAQHQEPEPLTPAAEDLVRWMEEVAGEGWRWFAKRLSGNDTLANMAHQAGPYIPRDAIFDFFPSLRDRAADLNPRTTFPVIIDSHSEETVATAIWYNNRVVSGGTRNEARITGWGGAASPILDPDSTGGICVFAFRQPSPREDSNECRVWVCRGPEDEEAVASRIGPIEPGQWILYRPAALEYQASPVDVPCALRAEELPREWLYEFPEAAALVARAVEHLPTARQEPSDARLLRRRDCEFELFRSVEEAVVFPRIREGFATVELFVAYANAVTNRRKARSGRSLQLHAHTILNEERVPHSCDEVSEQKKKPDFLFPSAEAYRTADFPADRLRMLAAKTTCKDRWRQILNEADRVRRKHLLTLQQGISLNQYAEMQAAGVILVVPRPYHSFFHRDIRPTLVTLEQFISETRECCTA